MGFLIDSTVLIRAEREGLSPYQMLSAILKRFGDVTLAMSVMTNMPPMITTVTRKNMVTVPAELSRQLGIRPGYRLEWRPIPGKDEVLVRVIPDRAELSRRLLGSGRRFSPERDAVAELVAERAEEG